MNYRYWCYRLDIEEDFNNDIYSSKLATLKAALKAAKGTNADSVELGSIEIYGPEINAKGFLNTLAETAINNGAEKSMVENWLSYISEGEIYELSDRLTKVFYRWAHRHYHYPIFGTIEHKASYFLDDLEIELKTIERLMERTNEKATNSKKIR